MRLPIWSRSPFTSVSSRLNLWSSVLLSDSGTPGEPPDRSRARLTLLRSLRRSMSVLPVLRVDTSSEQESSSSSPSLLECRHRKAKPLLLTLVTLVMMAMTMMMMLQSECAASRRAYERFSSIANIPRESRGADLGRSPLLIARKLSPTYHGSERRKGGKLQVNDQRATKTSVAGDDRGRHCSKARPDPKSALGSAAAYEQRERVRKKVRKNKMKAKSTRFARHTHTPPHTRYAVAVALKISRGNVATTSRRHRGISGT
uniref:Transmembrane protein n=1 Tax=Anopheles atroparvus TaxID=41427 RepID=A0A182IJZ5_ANOAO